VRDNQASCAKPGQILIDLLDSFKADSVLTLWYF